MRKKIKKTLSNQLLWDARSRGGKNGSHADKVKAGKAAYQAMLRKLQEKLAKKELAVIPVSQEGDHAARRYSRRH